jgi:hypothetical protein
MEDLDLDVGGDTVIVVRIRAAVADLNMSGERGETNGIPTISNGTQRELSPMP